MLFLRIKSRFFLHELALQVASARLGWKLNTTLGALWLCLCANALAQTGRVSAAEPAQPNGQRLPPVVLKALQQAQVPASALSVLIAPLPTQSNTTATTTNTVQPPSLPPRLSHQAQTPTHPASVMKLFTTYAGLSLLGPDHVWHNRVYADGPVRDGVLQGNLILRGSGDPKLVLERLQDLLGQVVALGVREVRGEALFDIEERGLNHALGADRDAVEVESDRGIERGGYVGRADPAQGDRRVALGAIAAERHARNGPCDVLDVFDALIDHGLLGHGGDRHRDLVDRARLPRGGDDHFADAVGRRVLCERQTRGAERHQSGRRAEGASGHTIPVEFSHAYPPVWRVARSARSAPTK